MNISIDAFQDDLPIPSKYTCDGEDARPVISIADIPENTQSFALIVDDPDAPNGTWTHWLVWNIPADTAQIGAALPDDAVQGTTSAGSSDWHGPCPPSGTHRYYWHLYALDTKLDLTGSADAPALRSALEGHVLDQAQYMGTYERR